MKQTCKAVVIKDVKTASLEEISLPNLGANEVAIEVAYIGICKTDLEILNGTLGYYKKNLAQYPIIPGHEVSGVIAKVGQNVTDFKVGDSVVVECIQGCGACGSCEEERPIGCVSRTELGVIGKNGGYSELITVSTRFVQRIPSNLSLKTACLSEPLAVVIKGLRRLSEVWGKNLKPKKCAVVGAGPIGRLCALVLANRGHLVTIFDQNEQRLEGIKTEIETAQTLENLEKIDAIIEATGEQSALEIVLEKSRAGVTILLLGFPYSSEKFSFEEIVANDKTIVGSVGSNSADFAEALLLLPNLDVSSFTQKVLPLEDFAKAWEIVRTCSELKVLLTPLNRGSV